jgi:hypothetical protein
MGTYSSLFKRKPDQNVPATSSTPPGQDMAEAERTKFRTEKRSEMRTDQLPIKRRTKRYSFEFYDDQIAKLKLLKRQAEDVGESHTLSDLAREAFDLYLNRKTTMTK